MSAAARTSPSSTSRATSRRPLGWSSRTAGRLGGWTQPGGPFRAAPPPGPVSDTYGAGDSFAAGLTYGLANGLEREEALELASRCGAAVLTGRGPYEGQLTD